MGKVGWYPRLGTVLWQRSLVKSFLTQLARPVYDGLVAVWVDLTTAGRHTYIVLPANG
jgi:hypothetical protein